MNQKITHSFISFAFQMIPPSWGRSRVDDTGRGRGAVLEMSAALSVYERPCPAATVGPGWPSWNITCYSSLMSRCHGHRDEGMQQQQQLMGEENKGTAMRRSWQPAPNAYISNHLQPSWTAITLSAVWHTFLSYRWHMSHKATFFSSLH